MQVVVVSNYSSRRTEFFCRAGVELGLSVHFMTYEELSERLSDMEDTVIKLEPVVSEESDFLRYARFDKDYREMLRMLGERPLSGSVRFLNTPASLLLAADKLRSKERMQDGGLRVTPLMGIPRSFDELKALLPAGQNGCFLKPRYGSGAGGIMAIRRRDKSPEWVSYTTLQAVDGHIHNTKRIHRLTQEASIALLAEAVIRTEAIMEEWIPKADWDGENYDLRVVSRGTEVDHIVVRCSRGTITNLHLNNRARSWDDLPVSDVVRQAVVSQSIRAGQIVGLHSAGVDLLLEKRSHTPFIVEVNGQGDHIYQDMFARNSIYTNQLKEIIKLC